MLHQILLLKQWQAPSVLLCCILWLSIPVYPEFLDSNSFYVITQSQIHSNPHGRLYTYTEYTIEYAGLHSFPNSTWCTVAQSSADYYIFIDPIPKANGQRSPQSPGCPLIRVGVDNCNGKFNALNWTQANPEQRPGLDWVGRIRSDWDWDWVGAVVSGLQGRTRLNHPITTKYVWIISQNHIED